VIRQVAVVIPGPPCPQGRGRIIQIRGRGAIKDPERSKNWKGAAQWHMQKALKGGLLDGKLRVRISAVFPCPLSDHRKTKPSPLRWHTKASGDADNLAKACLDAGNGVLWHDDRQVCSLTVEKYIAAQGEPPYTSMLVKQIEGDPE